MQPVIAQWVFGYDVRVPPILGITIFGLVFGLLIGLWTDRPRPQHTAAQTEQRFRDWAYVARTKTLGPQEELSLVIVPSEFGKVFDVRCIVYKNREFNQVVFTCPEAKQDQIEEGPAR